MKKLLIVSAIFLFCIGLASAKTYTVSTEHFDIIYTDESVKSADALYKNCERIYKEVSELVGYDGNISIPVYLSQDSKIYNGYETQWPYNRIVIYDTAPNTETMTYFKKQIVSVLKHELTHALMFEVKPNRFLKIGSKIFGDWFSLQGIFLYPSYVEGAAVMSESLDGMGRLNSNSATQMIKQAKIEGKFPSFFQTLGSRDIYPGKNISYIFGGAFTQYLRETYGEDKLREFYNKTGKLEWVEETGFKFMKTFDIREKFSWQNFYNSIQIPICREPNTISDYSHFATLKLVNNRIYALDSSKNAVFELSESKLIKTIKAISTEGALSIDLENNYLHLSDSQEKTSMLLKDSHGKLIHEFKDYINGTIAQSNGKTFYCLYRNESQETFLDIFDSDFNIIDTVNLGWEVYCFDFCNPLNDVVAFLKSNAGKRTVAFYNIATQKTSEADNPDDIFITSINSSPALITFSWTDQKSDTSMIRYGELLLEKSGFELNLKQRLSNVDLNGGIDHPVMADGLVTYIARFYENDAICTVETKELNLSEQKIVEVIPYNKPEYESIYGNITIKGRDYKPGKYFLDGTLLPFGSVSSTTNEIPLGFTFITKDPSEMWDFEGSLSYLLSTKQYNASNFISATFDKYRIAAKAQLCWPVVESRIDLGFEFTKPLLKPTSKIAFANTLSELYASANFQEAFGIYDTFAFNYSNLYSTGSKTFDYKGYTVYADINAGVVKNRFDWAFTGINASAYARIDLPSFGCEHYSAMIFGDIASNKPQKIGAQIEMLPLSLEIQNGFSFLGMYFNRFVIDVFGVGTYNLQKKDFDYFAKAYAYFTFSEAIGMAAYHNMNLGASVTYDIKNSSFKVDLYYDLHLDTLGIKGNNSPVER